MQPRLPPNQQWTRKFPITGEREPAPGLDRDSFRLTVGGLVRHPFQLDFAGLLALPQVQRTADIHCVTRWSKAEVTWSGVSLDLLLDRAQPLPEARFVRFLAHSLRDHETSLPLEFCRSGQVLVAHGLEGQPLGADHGGPVRTVTPRLYFYKSLKWLRAIELLAEDRLGTWEGKSGYHNQADPWLEQRYIVQGVSRQKLTEYLASGRFSGASLLQADLAGRDLRGFDFAGAGVKDSSFRGANLQGADFRGANLTNSDLRGADLRNVNFEGADLEGVRFAGADLRGACLREASLTAAEFYDRDAGPESMAQMDGGELRGAQLQGLVEDQKDALQERFGLD